MKKNMLLIIGAILLVVKLKLYGNENTIFERKEISIVSGLGFIFWLQQTNVENILIEPQHSQTSLSENLISGSDSDLYWTIDWTLTTSRLGLVWGVSDVRPGAARQNDTGQVGHWDPETV